jgi:hypothetical protein
MSIMRRSVAGGSVISLFNETTLQDFRQAIATKAIQGFDLYHQLYRLKNARNMSEAEAELITRTLVENVHSYDQVVEVSISPVISAMTYEEIHRRSFLLASLHTWGVSFP